MKKYKMPNNKEYQKAYNKRYYEAQKEYLNWVRGCYKRTPLPKKERNPKPVTVEPYVEPERKQVVEIKSGEFLIDW